MRVDEVYVFCRTMSCMSQFCRKSERSEPGHDPVIVTKPVIVSFRSDPVLTDGNEANLAAGRLERRAKARDCVSRAAVLGMKAGDDMHRTKRLPRMPIGGHVNAGRWGTVG